MNVRTSTLSFGNTCLPSSMRTDAAPGMATNRLARAPSFHCDAFGTNGSTPGAGVQSRTEENRPVSLSFVGNFCVDAVSSLGTMR